MNKYIPITRMKCRNCSYEWLLYSDVHNGTMLASGKIGVFGHCPACYTYEKGVLCDRPNTIVGLYNRGDSGYAGKEEENKNLIPSRINNIPAVGRKTTTNDPLHSLDLDRLEE